MLINEIANLFELDVKIGGYAGRRLAIPGKTILWQYITYPRTAGLIMTLPDGTTLLNGKEVGNTELTPSDNKFTHKRQIADNFSELRLERYLEKSGMEYRDFIEDMYERNVRGRVLNDGSGWTAHVWDYNAPEAKINRAVDALYKHLPSEYT